MGSIALRGTDQRYRPHSEAAINPIAARTPKWYGRPILTNEAYLYK